MCVFPPAVPTARPFSPLPLQMADKLEEVNTEITEVQARLSDKRDELVREIGGEDAYPDSCKCASPAVCTCKFEHVSLRHLIRLKAQRGDVGSSARVSFATTLALRVERAREAAAGGQAPGMSQSLGGDSYGDDGYDTEENGSGKGDAEGKAGEEEPAGDSEPVPAQPHLSQTEIRLRQLRAYVCALYRVCDCVTVFACVPVSMYHCACDCVCLCSLRGAYCVVLPLLQCQLQPA